MRTGTPGFVAQRLREAREARGITATALADMVGVSKQAISQYEHGVQTPNPDVMQHIAIVLNLPEAFFRWQREEIRTQVFYRSLSAATKSARTRADRKLGWLIEIVGLCTNYVDFPAVRFPDYGPPRHPAEIRIENTEEYAARAREFFGLGKGPISNIVGLLENNGAIVARHDLASDTLDALSSKFTDFDRPYILLGIGKGSAVRSRFDTAHELGHLIVHRNVAQESLTRSPDHKLMELQAHRFAGAFLMPAETFASEIHGVSLDDLLALKDRWRVSVAAMLHRLADLDLVDENHAQRLWSNYARRGWRRGEPLDSQMLPEVPRLLRRALETIIASGVLRTEVLQALRFSPGDIEVLAGLPDGWMSQPANVRNDPPPPVPFRRG